MSRPSIGRADWDHEAEVWVANSPELRGSNTEAEAPEQLRKKLPGMNGDLFDKRGDADLPVSIELIAYAHDLLAVAQGTGSMDHTKRPKDRLQPSLRAQQSDPALTWGRALPLLAKRVCVFKAGLPR